MENNNLAFRSKLSYIASLLILALLLFLINLFIRKLEQDSIWNISIAVASLLGVLATAGAAFATVAAIISYVSVNDKLKLSSENLNAMNEKIAQNKEVLEGIEELIEKKNGIQKIYNELSFIKNNQDEEINKDEMSEIDSFLLKGNIDNFDKEKTNKLLQKIIDNEYPYQLKIKAKIIKLNLLISNLSKEKVEDIYYAYSELERCCEILFFYDESVVEQYMKAIFNKAYYLNRVEFMFDKFSQVQDLYRKAMYINRTYSNKKSFEKISYNNLGCLLFNKAHSNYEKGDEISNEIFYESIMCLIKAISLDYKYEKAINNFKNYIQKRFKLVDDKENLKHTILGMLKLLSQSDLKKDLIEFINKL